MSKREKRRLVKSVFQYLESQKNEAYVRKNSRDFGWYGEGQEIFYQVLTDQPLKITPRVKPL